MKSNPNRRQFLAAAAAPLAFPTVAPAGARSRIEASIRRWTEARRSEASASELLEDHHPRLSRAGDRALTTWYEARLAELIQATEDLVQALREAGLRGYVLDGNAYLDASHDLCPIDGDLDDVQFRIAAVPISKVAGLG